VTRNPLSARQAFAAAACPSATPGIWIAALALAGALSLSAPVRAQSLEQATAALDPQVTGSTRPRVVSGLGPEQAVAARQGSYGGGFIEMLMTGRDPTPRRGAIYNEPREARTPGTGPGMPGRSLARNIPYAEPVDPMLGQTLRERPAPRGRQVAGLNDQRVDEDVRPIARALDPRFRRQEVAYDGPHRPGTVVIDTPNKFLYLVQPGGRALRYGIGVGRPGFEWAGAKTVTRKAQWPDWRPPAQMLKRRPDLPRFMEGGPDNPLGARALYLGSSLYRIHGTNEPHTIGQAVSSGCIRMTNDDVIDLYGRVGVGTRVIVI
jgi:lipoprotein-anchoring transpeptidase ErfK/SrfK